MSQRDGFSGGFVLGTIVGGIVGGVVGALLTARQFTAEEEGQEQGTPNKALKPTKPSRKRGSIKPGREGVDMEAARRSLEDKIAQLNDAIDDVRQQLGGENENAAETVSQPANPPDNRP
ncbi:MAG: hypothetical protein NW224_27120 [Leptolyngbyaceae cyanobacterium bins.302]|nr:hypothetical protein [Leptolyngbyaceae cyanobacterium bins.302]